MKIGSNPHRYPSGMWWLAMNRLLRSARRRDDPRDFLFAYQIASAINLPIVARWAGGEG